MLVPYVRLFRKMISKHFTLQYIIIIIIIIINIYLQLLYIVTMHLPVKRKTWCTVKNSPNREICMRKFKEKYIYKPICPMLPLPVGRASREYIQQKYRQGLPSPQQGKFLSSTLHSTKTCTS